MERKTDSVVISYTRTNDTDGLLVVGTFKDKKMDVINAFQGPEASFLWHKLTKKNVEADKG